MRRYDSYKDSNTLQFGMIPEHWEEVKIQYCFKERSQKGFPNEPMLCATQSQGVIPQSMYNNRVVVVNKDFDKQKLVKIGDFVISLRSFEGGIEYAYYQGIISAAYTILIPNEGVNIPYFKLLFKSFNFIQLLRTCVTGIREGQNINYRLLGKHYIPIPPIEEQRVIVEYLNRKTGLIERQKKDLEREVQLLEELKQAEIAEAVTHGLNPGAPMKESGVEWIGKIPSHWKVLQIKRIFEEDNERNENLEFELMSFSKKRGIIPFAQLNEKAPSALDLTKYRIIRPGQLLENRMQAWHGMFAYVDKVGCISPDYSVFKVRPHIEVNVKYYEHVFRTSKWVQQFANSSKGIGSGFNRLYTPQFGAIFTLLLPIEEQKAIVEYIERKAGKIDEMIDGLKKQIDYLTEYKQRLIADVVTGQINVQPN